MQLAALAGAATITASAAAAQSKPSGTRIQMLVYPGMTLQDLVGPLQVWAAWPGAQIQFAWKSTGPVPTDSGLAVVATTSFADAWPDPDILFAPGGLLPTFELLDDAEVIEFLRKHGEQAKWVTSVCTGAVLLGAAGLLRGYRAATHWFARDSLALFGATPSSERWVIDRNRATGAGVTAGIDFGLAVLSLIPSWLAWCSSRSSIRPSRRSVPVRRRRQRRRRWLPCAPPGAGRSASASSRGCWRRANACQKLDAVN
jgi:cyclohexyl-isocyanide hydratase